MVNMLSAEATYGFFHQATPTTAIAATTNAAATWQAFSFYVKEAKTVDSIRFFIAGKTGTPASTEISCSIYSSTTTSTPSPNASLQTSTTTGGFTAGAWTEWTGFTQALTANTMYWVVFKNTNGTPASNFVTLRHSSNNAGGHQSYQAETYLGWNRRQSSDSGVGWNASTWMNILPGMVVKFSDATFTGTPFEDSANPADRVHSGVEIGVVATMPATDLKVAAVCAFIGKGGSPTGTYSVKIYDNTATLVATSTAIAAATIQSGMSYYQWHFTTPVTLTRNLAYDILLSASDANSSSAYIATGYQQFESATTYQTLRPMGGRWYKSSRSSGGVFTRTANQWYPFALILDSGSNDTATPTSTLLAVTDVRKDVAFTHIASTGVGTDYTGTLVGSVMVI